MIMQKIDEPDCAELLLMWESKAAVDRFNKSGVLEASLRNLMLALPGTLVQRPEAAVSITLMKTSLEDLYETRPTALQLR